MTEETLKLTGNKALILGANVPEAAAVALALARAGADVAVTSSTGDAEEAFSLRPLRRDIEAAGRQAIADVADLGNGSSVQIAVRQIARQLGRLDIVAVVASEALEKPSERVSDAEWHRLLGFNLGAYFYAARAAAREFAGNEPADGVRGRFIALLPEFAGDASAVRLAARSGTEALLAGLSREWAASGIVVTSVEVLESENEETIAEHVFRALDATLPQL